MASVSAFCYTGAQPVDILKIATFNINGIRSRLPALEWLEREGPDVVCLQELKAPRTRHFRSMTFTRLVTEPSGMGRHRGTVWPSWPKGRTRWKAGAGFLATKATRTAAISKERCTT